MEKIGDKEKQDSNKIIIYTRRWFMLVLFCIYGIGNTVQYIQYSIIADVVVEYYDVSFTAVDWSAMIFAVTYVAFSFPGGYILDKLGLRRSVIIGAVGTALGAWIKVLSVDPDRYWVVLLGQAVVSVFQICIFPLTPKLAANWFGAAEISTAGALGWVGVLMGNAIGFLIPPLLISRGDVEEIERGFYIINLSYSTFCTAVIPLLYFCFAEQPPTPPSLAQAKAIEIKSNAPIPFKDSIKNLFTNKSYILYLIIFSVNIGIFTPFQVLFNQIVLNYYPDASSHVGIIGLLTTFISFSGSFVVCLLLDKFKKYKEITLITHALYFFSLVLYTATLDQGIGVLYFTSILFGILMGAVLTLGIQVVLELTYPEAENITSGLCVNLASVMTIVFTMLYSHIYQNVSIMWANITICTITLASNLLLFFMKFELRRQNVEIEVVKTSK